MKILVTGSQGFVGSYVMKQFPEAVGYDIKEVSEDNISNESHLYHILDMNNIETVIHLAAYVSVADSEKHPQAYLKNNIEGTLNVIKASIRAKVKKIIYASSSACSEPSSSIYAVSKYTPELLLEYYKDQIQTIALRFYNIYGIGSNPVYGRVIDEFIKGTKEKGEITIYGDGHQTRDFIFIEDVIRAIRLAVVEDVPSGTVMDIGTGIATSIRDLASIVATLLDKQPKINYASARKEAQHSQANLEKAVQFLSFKPEVDLREGLQKIIGI